jgi:hypothetical protein
MRLLKEIKALAPEKYEMQLATRVQTAEAAIASLGDVFAPLKLPEPPPSADHRPTIKPSRPLRPWR